MNLCRVILVSGVASTFLCFALSANVYAENAVSFDLAQASENNGERGFFSRIFNRSDNESSSDPIFMGEENSGRQINPFNLNRRAPLATARESSGNWWEGAMAEIAARNAEFDRRYEMFLAEKRAAEEAEFQMMTAQIQASFSPEVNAAGQTSNEVPPRQVYQPSPYQPPQRVNIQGQANQPKEETRPSRVFRFD